MALADHLLRVDVLALLSSVQQPVSLFLSALSSRSSHSPHVQVLFRPEQWPDFTLRNLNVLRANGVIRFHIVVIRLSLLIPIRPRCHELLDVPRRLLLQISELLGSARVELVV